MVEIADGAMVGVELKICKFRRTMGSTNKFLD
jgi:hypothetical protein